MNASTSGAPPEDQLRLEGVQRWFQGAGGLFAGRRPMVRAVDGVSLGVQAGRTLGLVGESGCGKTTLGRLIVRLLDPTAGRILFERVDIASLRPGALRRLRPRVQMVFQDTQSSLDPRMTVEAAVAEPLTVNRLARAHERRGRVAELLERCGLGVEHMQRYPHELSGGQRQRVVIARALATNPDLVVLDEPTSALDVSVQAQILNLLKDLQDELGLTYVFISHDLSVIRSMSDDVAVMYLGEIVEQGPAEAVFRSPLHPYTRTLLAAMPRPDPRRRRSSVPVKGGVPRADTLPSGCRFHPRCPRAEDLCSREAPTLLEYAPSHAAACHFAAELRDEPFVPTVTQRR